MSLYGRNLTTAHVFCENTEFMVDNEYSSYFVSFRLQVLMSSYCALFWTNEIGHHLLRSYWTSSIKRLCICQREKAIETKTRKGEKDVKIIRVEQPFFNGSRSWNWAGRLSKDSEKTLILMKWQDFEEVTALLKFRYFAKANRDVRRHESWLILGVNFKWVKAKKRDTGSRHGLICIYER